MGPFQLVETHNDLPRSLITYQDAVFIQLYAGPGVRWVPKTELWVVGEEAAVERGYVVPESGFMS